MKNELKFYKRLTLNRETICTLTDAHLRMVAGGITRGDGCGTNTCNTCLADNPCDTQTSKGNNCTSGQRTLCGQNSCVTCLMGACPTQIDQ